MRHNPSLRRGAIAPLAALLMIPLMGMLAFGIDIGWITHSHNELQSAADAAALAGAGQLADDYVRYHLPGATEAQKAALIRSVTAKARGGAKTYASHNRAGDVNSLTLLDDDIELGFTDTKGKYTPLPAYGGYPNTVKVLARRDATANQPLPMFFGRILGVNTVDLGATATASMMAGTVDGFRNSPFRTRILPMTYDVNHWSNYVETGKGLDGGISDAPDGLSQLNIYPSIKYSGNFGELSLDQGNNGASVIKGWIAEGITGEQLRPNYAGGLLPLSAHDPNSLPDWKGNPGLKTSTIQEVGDNVGGLYLLPLFKPFSPGVGDGVGYQAGIGQGSNHYYTIVAFVGVQITSVDATGSNKAINVRPSALIDPNALYNTPQPVQPPSSGTTLATTFLGARLVN